MRPLIQVPDELDFSVFFIHSCKSFLFFLTLYNVKVMVESLWGLGNQITTLKEQRYYHKDKQL